MKLTRKIPTYHWSYGLIVLIFSSIQAFSDVPSAVSNNKHLLEPLSQLLNEFDITHDGCLSSMIEASQQWRRKPAQERWELPDINLSAEKTHRVFQLLKQLRMTGSIEPSSNQYDYLLLLGSTAPGMLHRLQHLTELWDKGLRFKHLIFLVSERPLHATMDRVKLNVLTRAFSSPKNQDLNNTV